MTATKNFIGTSLVLIACCAFASCGHDNGSAGTTNGTSAEAYYYNDRANLAAPMDSVADTTRTAPTPAVSAKPAAADSAK
ncbi:MAG: hypothetical protein ABI373_10305 [Flavobacteriales bacterium]